MSTPTAGRELDTLIAEVMGWQVFPYTTREGLLDRSHRDYCPPGKVHCSTITPVPNYSTDIAAAWEVVEVLRAKWATYYNAKCGEPDVWRFFDLGEGGWVAEIVWLHHDGESIEAQATALTLPHAICLALLETVGYGAADNGCPLAGTAGVHSNDFYEDGMCRWCGASPQ
jgi:hypothetical protein